MNAPTPVQPKIAQHIVIGRDADGFVSLTIDGEPFPYAIAAEPSVSTTLTVGAPSILTLSLVCGTLTVRDQAGVPFVAAEHDHEHGIHPDEAEIAAQLRERPKVAPAPVDKKAERVEEPCGTGCSLVCLKPGYYVCDENTPTCPRLAAAR